MKVFRVGRSQSCSVKNVSKILLLFLGLFVMASFLYAGGGKYVTGAKIYIQQNKLDDAARVLYKELNEEDPNNEDAWYLLGYIYARRAKYDSMMVAFDKAVELKPEFKKEGEGVDVSKDTGTRFRSEFGTEMIKSIIWSDVFNAGVKNFNDALNAVDEAEKTKSFEEAARKFKLTTEIMPDSIMGYRNLSASLMNMGKYEESLEPLQEALNRDPDNVEVATLLAQNYMITSQDSLAIPLLAELWEKGHHSEEVAEFLSRAYLNADETEKAKGIYKKAIEENPDNYNFRYNYGTVLLEAQEYDGAIKHLSKAYELNPETPELNYNLGAAYLNRGVAKHDSLPEDSEDMSYKEDFKKAQPYLEKAIKLNPDDQQTWFALGQIAGQLNKISLAGYAFAKGDPVRTALNQKVVVGMQADQLTSIFGEPDKVNSLESEQFQGVEEWVYTKRAKTNAKLAVPEPINVYVKNGRVDAIMLQEN
ncbi:tetratricopeptide repeat protein [candidate division KSB1 bacterium]|nr:tetratricopeptide repeat protein [candidate division KSB1 bacterium]NIR71339.1 tetratricopeptide repeat protein [candidate division KSB1 bacterium]NIS26229.1 tetratricopeptide repeat protein [candidate division KSB1 bacterium]NIT74659.1 tetratricopeptide repeat protein [candidate division KSB1 bacterium]NIU26877.1 tetratricopeptide repeat protein [candidate division KSB1 bacterium]